MRRSAYRRLSEDEEDDEADGYAEDDDDQVRDDAPSSVSFRRHPLFHLDVTHLISHN